MKKQNGFTILETLIALLLAAVIGFGGYYVWHNQKSATLKAPVAAHTKTTKPTTPVPATVSAPTATPTTVTPAPVSQKYFTMKEWGVRAPYNGSLTLQYQIVTQSGQTWAYFSSDQLAATDPACSVSNGPAGVINRVAAGDPLPLPDGTNSDQTIEQAIAAGTLKSYSHVGNYYYYYDHSQAACGSTTASDDLQSQTSTAVTGITKTLQTAL